MYIHTYTYIHTYIHTYILIYTPLFGLQEYMYVCIIYIYIYIYIHTLHCNIYTPVFNLEMALKKSKHVAEIC